MKIFWGIVIQLIMIGTILNSCSKDNANDVDQVVQIPIEFSLKNAAGIEITDGSSVDLDSPGGELKFDINSNALWKIRDEDIDSSWIIITPIEGVRDGSFTVKTLANKSGSMREQTIILDVANKPGFLTINFKQEVLADAMSVVYNNANKEPSYEHSIDLDIVASSDWDVDFGNSSSWVTENSRGEENISLLIEKNEGDERNGQIKFFLKSNHNVSQTINLVQLQGMVVADYLDVIFHEDGTAEDISIGKHKVQNFNGKNIYTIEYNNTYNRNVVNFNPEPENITESEDDGGFFRIDNSSDFNTFTSAGTSWEVLVKVNTQWGSKGYEGKFFSMHEAGGIGFLISNSSRGNSLTWLPNISSTDGGASNWVWTPGPLPIEGQWYHLVGTWDKNTGQSKIFVDGVLTTTAGAAGFYRPASGGINWISIGGDPNGSSQSTNAAKVSIGIARIYKHALSQEDVEFLWNHIDK